MNKQEELIDKIIKDAGVVRSSPNGEYIISSLRKNLPTINPNKIDEERFKSIYNSLPSLGFEASFSQDAVKEYNSTLEDHQVLQPLPDEMPDEFKLNYSLMTAPYTWNWLVKTYSSPTKKELVSVDKLTTEIFMLGDINNEKSKQLAQHIIDTYSLNPAKREWWMDLKVGEQFKDRDGFICKFNGNHHIEDMSKSVHYINHCTPYIEPTIFDRLKAKGVTDDEINELINQHEKQEFMKEVKGC